LADLKGLSTEALLEKRYQKYRVLGRFDVEEGRKLKAAPRRKSKAATQKAEQS